LRSSFATDVTASSAPDADTLSCAIAGRYAGRWARSVAPAPEDDAPGTPAPWFVDGFAGADLQRAAMRGAAVQPACIAAIQALDPVTRIVLVEEDPGLISRLCEALDDIGAVERIRVTSDPATAEPGEIALAEAPFARVAPSLASAIGDDPALVRLAPLAARTLPWAALEPFGDLSATDILLRVPLEDFARQARFNSPLADLPPHIRRVVEGCSALLSDVRHGWLLAWREAQRTGGTDAAVATVIKRMQALLAGGDDARSAHALPVEGAGGPVHLLLSTPDPAHALELDGALADGAAKPKRAAARKASKSPPVAEPDPAAATKPAVSTEPTTPPTASTASARSTEPATSEPPTPAQPVVSAEPIAPPVPAAATKPPAGKEPPAALEPAPALDLFGLTPEPEPEARGPDLQAVADALYARHAGTRVAVGELLSGVADSGLTPEQVHAALALLKRAGRAAYRSLDADGAEVEFLAEPRVAAPRAKKPRAPAPGVLGLFDEPEE
jgi:hypothetical protein